MRASQASLLSIATLVVLAGSVWAGYWFVLRPRFNLAAYAERLESALPEELKGGFTLHHSGKRNLFGLRYPLTVSRVYERSDLPGEEPAVISLRVVAWNGERAFDYRGDYKRISSPYSSKLKIWDRADGAHCREIELLVSPRVEFETETCASEQRNLPDLEQMLDALSLNVFEALDRNAPSLKP